VLKVLLNSTNQPTPFLMTHWNLTMIFGIRKVDSLGHRCLRDPTTFLYNSNHNLWRTDRQVDRHSIEHALSGVA